MGTNLYLFFDAAESGSTLPARIRELRVPGFTRFDRPLRPEIEVAGETLAIVRFMFYAQNHFQIFVADLALQFCRETPPPPEVVAGEQAFRTAVFRLAPFTEVYPDRSDAGVWSDGPLIDNARGTFFYFGMVRSRAKDVAPVVARIAVKHGLVCFDPQSGRRVR